MPLIFIVFDIANEPQRHFFIIFTKDANTSGADCVSKPFEN